jgi:hypothetical protein
MTLIEMVQEALQMIPVAVRRVLYVLVVAAMVVQGAVAIWYDDPDPDFVRKAGDVLQYLSGFVVVMALANAKNVQGKHEA